MASFKKELFEDVSQCSSSCLPDKVIHIHGFRCYDSIEHLKDLLEEKGFSVSSEKSAIPAGRQRLLNFESLIKHANYIIFLLTEDITNFHLDELFEVMNSSTCLKKEILLLSKGSNKRFEEKCKSTILRSCKTQKVEIQASVQYIAECIVQFLQQCQKPVYNDLEHSCITDERNMFRTIEEDAESYHTALSYDISRGPSPTYGEENCWTPVLTKKQPKHKTSALSHNTTPVHAHRSFINEQTLTDTVTGFRKHNSIICYAKSPYDDDKNGYSLFSQDIVSLWNVPNRQQCYICIGAEYINEDWIFSDYVVTKQEWDFQNMFQENAFSYTPDFYLETTKIKEKDITVIVVDEPQNHDGPCCALESGPDGLWDMYDVYVRENGTNVPATEQLQTVIFDWFQKENKLASDSQLKFNQCQLEIDKLLEMVDNFSDKRAYFLLISQVQNCQTYVENIANIQWRRVIDFDPKSRVSGVLRYVEGRIKARRFLSITDIQDEPPRLSEHSTDWVCANGSTSRSDTSFAATSPQWFKQNRKYFKQQCHRILEYDKPPMLIVMCYDEDDMFSIYKFMDILCYEMDESNDLIPFVFCFPSVPEVDSRFNHFLEDNCLLTKIVELSFENVCEVLSKIAPDVVTTTTDHSTLPKYSVCDKNETVSISKEDMAWLKVHLEVLSLSDSDALNQHLQNCNDSGEAFLKGGLISWEEIHIGAFHATRTIHENSLKCISKAILHGKSSVINIYHAPGGGGTTFSRHLLWDLRERAPCTYLNTSGFPVQEIKQRIAFLSEKTFLPVVLLVDGRSEDKVQTLLDRIHYEKVIILHVQRYNLPIPKSELKDNRIFLTDRVTATEALHLGNIFQSVCVPSRKKEINNLSEEILQNEPHYMFEFGVTSFQHEYHGVTSYVQGYLQAEPGKNVRHILDWQKILGFVSLSYFYGHSTISAHFFRNILGLGDIVNVSDLPMAAQRFIYEDSNHLWKISYYIIAKEILEQLLAARENAKTTYNVLSAEAKAQLHWLVLDFIKVVQKRCEHHKYSTKNIILDAVASIFLKRDYRYMDSNDVFGGSKLRLSRLLEDIVDDDKREMILKLLVQTFPEEHIFRAHLGRFYSFVGKFDGAETELQLALDILDEQLSSIPKSYQVKKNLSQTHAMFGFCCVKKLENKLRCRLGCYRYQREHQQRIFQDVIFAISRSAIRHFEQSRLLCKSRNRTYGYLGEIKMRLQVIEYLKTIYSNGWSSFVFDEENSKPSFVQKCLPICDTLLTECANVTSPTELMKIAPYYECVNLFTAYFHSPEKALEEWQGGDSTLSRRNQISIIKMKHHKASKHSSRTLTHVDQIKDPKDFLKIVNLYEQSIRHELLKKSTDIRISSDMLEWLYAIRSELISEDYKLADVLHVVTQWDQLTERDSLSTYYRYVLYTVLAITLPGNKHCEMYAKQSSEVRKSLMASRHYLPDSLSKITREWMSNHETASSIRKLMHYSKLGEWNSDDKIWKDPAKRSFLRPFVGIVFKSSDPYGGIIHLDNKSIYKRKPISIFFVPKNYNMYGKRFSQESLRVEFYLGFSPEHGATAYFVKPLLKKSCHICSMPVEIRTLGERKLNVCPKCHNIVHIPN